MIGSRVGVNVCKFLNNPIPKFTKTLHFSFCKFTNPVGVEHLFGGVAPTAVESQSNICSPTAVGGGGEHAFGLLAPIC
jgi:hypothetical protein